MDTRALAHLKPKTVPCIALLMAMAPFLMLSTRTSEDTLLNDLQHSSQHSATKQPDCDRAPPHSGTHAGVQVQVRRRVYRCSRCSGACVQMQGSSRCAACAGTGQRQVRVQVQGRRCMWAVAQPVRCGAASVQPRAATCCAPAPARARAQVQGSRRCAAGVQQQVYVRRCNAH